MTTAIENYKTLVEQELKSIFVSLKIETRNGNLPGVLYQAMHYSVFNGGKRIRPVLCLASYSACHLKTNNQQLKTILPFACGIEFIHTFSLIQDDLPSMDNDDFRRGKPSLHRTFDESIALLTADGLFALAFELFAKARIDEKRKNRAIIELSRICGPIGLVAGQVLDIAKKSQKLKYKSQKLIDEKKTAELIAGAMKVGAIVAGAKERVINNIEKAGTYLGLLFQTTDDIIDKNQKSNIKYQISKAKGYAGQAKAIFTSLGKRFDWFNTFTDYLLKREA
jgi:geranylgeranyl diphosphate synthase type II